MKIKLLIFLALIPVTLFSQLSYKAPASVEKYFCRMSTNFTTTSDTYVDVPGLSLDLPANSTFVMFLNFFANCTYPGAQFRAVGVGFSVVGATYDPTLVFFTFNDVMVGGGEYYLTDSGNFGYCSNLGYAVTGAFGGTLKFQLRAITGYQATVYAGSCILLIK